jgi:hypothetical protein
MSLVIAAPELVRGVAQGLASVGSSLTESVADALGPTTGLASAAQDEVSVAIASLFGDFGREFQGLHAQARAFHAQFVRALNASAEAYVGAELANARVLLGEGVLGGAQAGAPAASSALAGDLSAFGTAAAAGLAAPYQALASTTATNAQTVFAASGQALNSLYNGISTEFGLLATNPTAFLSNLGAAARSVGLFGAHQDFASAVVEHTLGGVTTAFDVNGGPTAVPNSHIEVYEGLVGTADFGAPSGLEGQLLTAVVNAASSPLSGVLIGFAGPLVSPGVALFNEAQTIFNYVTGGNPAAALTELVNTPATVINAYFNGATLNLDPLAPLFNGFVGGGSEGAEQLDGISLAFGGLFSPGQVVTGPGGPTYYGTGGSAFNALGLTISFLPPDPFAGGYIDIPAVPVGPIGATAGLIDIIGQALGGTLLD